MSGKALHDMLLKYGCTHVRTAKGSHFIVENPANGKRAPVPVHAGKDLGKGLFATILRQLYIDANDFLEFMKNN
jgi:predicted RNA binding protein YcfA (HicA-like mRNA interferase family)